MSVRELRGKFVGIAALVAALTATVAFSLPPAQPAGAAGAAPPVLEFVAPSFPVPFVAEGGAVTAALQNFDTVVHCERSSGSGELTGPRTALSHYVFTGCETQGGADGGRECKSEGAEAEEIRSGQIEAELVFLNQIAQTVAMLIAPHGGVYLSFECGGEAVKAIGPFLSPVGPVNTWTAGYSASLYRNGAAQAPHQYEGLNGEILEALPTGERGSEAAVTTGVELGFAIRTAVPIELAGLNATNAERVRLDRERLEAEKKGYEEQLARDAAAKKEREEAVAALKLQEEEAKARAKAKAQARHLSKALRQCRKLKPGNARSHCEARAKKKYGRRNQVATASA